MFSSGSGSPYGPNLESFSASLRLELLSARFAGNYESHCVVALTGESAPTYRLHVVSRQPANLIPCVPPWGTRQRVLQCLTAACEKVCRVGRCSAIIIQKR